MKKYFIVFKLCLIITLSFGQIAPPEYNNLIGQADSLYRAKNYLDSGQKYSAAFQSFGGLGYPDDIYNAACSWALAENADSAFINLQRIVDKAGYSNYKHIISDTDLNFLHTDKRWTTLISQIKHNKEKIEEKYNKPLLYLLDSMKMEDQRWRNYMTRFINGELHNDTISKETINLHISLTDSLNYFLLKDIFYKYGFPNYDLVGQEGSNNFWLLVQHQDSYPNFQDSVLTKMKIEVNNNKASSVNYAYLVDRVKINTGKQQVYGTQMELNKEQTSYIPLNVMAPEKLNERRASVGLISIESYIEIMNKRYFGSLKQADEIDKSRNSPNR
ncbi:MAG: hypothetical protein M9897_01255 [Brumimicrobium sp.]|nr:hypothetical protein [Brumimicrobium sp.]